MEERKALRANLECKDFGWYISKVTMTTHQPYRIHTLHKSLNIPFRVKVATSLWEPHIVGMGEVWNPHHGFCLDQQDGAANVGLPLLVFDCHGEKGNQYWYYRSDGTLGHDLLCVVERQGAAGESPLVLGPCRSESSISLMSNTFSDRSADRWQYEARSCCY